MSKKTVCRFKRAIFLSWYCELGDCKFCYMSTQKENIKDPKKARRSRESILAEVLLCKKLGWDIEFISVGYGAFDFQELLQYLKAIKKIWGKKLWLNVGYLDETQIKQLKPLIEGISVSIETVNWRLRKELCPSKSLKPMLKTLELCDRHHLKKSMTLILGLGEKIEDFDELKKFIKKHGVDRITFYRLKPQKGTIFENKNQLKTKDYTTWIKKTRASFPKTEIIVGSWLSNLTELEDLLKAGADHITKFPSIKLFGSRQARMIEQAVQKAGKISDNLTVLPKIDWQDEIKKHKLNKRVFKKIKEYLKLMKRDSAKWMKSR